MSKVQQECPNCKQNFIIVMFNKEINQAWPSCWNCGFEGRTKEEKEALIIHVLEDDKMNKDNVFREASENWNEYIILLDEEQ